MTHTTHKTIADVAHNWAYSSEGDTGQTSSNTFSYRNNVLYSYNTAIFKKVGGVCLQNFSKYSVTTSSHQSLGLRSYPDNSAIITALWEDARTSVEFSTYEIINSYLWKLDDVIVKMEKAKQKRTKIKFELELSHVATELKALIKHKILLKKDLTAPLKTLLKDESNLSEKMVKVKKRELVKLKRKELKALGAKKEKGIKFINGWRNFQESAGFFASHFAVEVYTKLILKKEVSHYPVRFNQEKQIIETMGGAHVPIEDALKLYRLAKLIKNGDKKSNNLRLGEFYKVDSIDLEGNAKIGCHNIAFQEMERCFNEEYEPTK